MIKNHFKRTCSFFSLFALISCASVPTDINISPDLNLKADTYAFSNENEWKINSQDLRIARHLVQIVDGDKAAKLINERESMRLLIDRNLSQAWLYNKLKVADQSKYKINIKLVRALATVTEAAISHEVKSEFIIQIQLINQANEYTKLFSSNNQWEASFTADIPDITKKLSLQLSELLNQIIQDRELNDNLQKFNSLISKEVL